jgi:uncharacterized protein (DUF1778 family)
MPTQRASQVNARTRASNRKPMSLKDQRLNIRASQAEKAVVEEAASVRHMGVSQFMLQAALRSAEEVLADQSRFVVPAGKWRDFLALLDRPARVIPALADAASKPTAFSER